MDQNVLQQLKVVNQLRRLNKAGEEMTWVNLLEYMGITEDDYLEYGRIWREFGGEDPSASLRQKDQFIFLDNLPQLCEKVKHIFRLNIDEFTEKEIANMDIPIMEFSYGEKVHRSDVTYALFNLTPLMKDMGPDFETEKKRLDNQILEHLLKRYPTRELMNDYVVSRKCSPKDLVPNGKSPILEVAFVQY